MSQAHWALIWFSIKFNAQKFKFPDNSSPDGFLLNKLGRFALEIFFSHLNWTSFLLGTWAATGGAFIARNFLLDWQELTLNFFGN